MTKIKRLTPEQEALLPLYRDKWLKIGLSTEPLDFERAKAAVNEAYRTAELNPPNSFYRFQSPYSAALGTAILQNISPDQVRAQVSDQVYNRVRDQVSDQVYDQIYDQIYAQVRAQVSAQVRNQVHAQVRDQVRDQVSAQVYNRVRDQVSDQVYDQVGDQVRDQVHAQVYYQVGDQVFAQVFGNHDAAWLAYLDFLCQLPGVQGGENIQGLCNLAQHCGWWAPYESTAILQDRPSLIQFDDQNRLHREDGPAVEYRDGFGVYCWHGTRIPCEWITNPKSLTPQTALTHENVEQRRAACEILGWETILAQLNAVTIHRDPDPQIGELVEVEIPGVGRERFLQVQCGTGRMFALPVPPDMETALQANAWSYNLNPSEYQPEIRT